MASLGVQNNDTRLLTEPKMILVRARNIAGGSTTVVVLTSPSPLPVRLSPASRDRAFTSPVSETGRSSTAASLFLCIPLCQPLDSARTTGPLHVDRGSDAAGQTGQGGWRGQGRRRRRGRRRCRCQASTASAAAMEAAAVAEVGVEAGAFVAFLFCPSMSGPHCPSCAVAGCLPLRFRRAARYRVRAAFLSATLFGLGWIVCFVIFSRFLC